MAIAYVQIDTHKRSLGHSVAAALAYRTGLCLRDIRTGELHDYRPRETREEIADAAIISSRATPLAEDWQTLADAIESREKHPKAWILRDVKVAIPHELSLDQKKELARKIGEFLAEYGDTIVGHALHAPSAAGDERNWHTHHVMATRSLTEDGTAFGAKLSKLDSKYSSPEEVAHIRNMIGDLINDALREADIDEEVHMGKRIDEPPRPRIPGELVGLARRRNNARTRDEVTAMPDREVVELALKNGDLDRHSATRALKQPRRRHARAHRDEARRVTRRSRARRSNATERVQPRQAIRRRGRVQRRRELRAAERATATVELARKRTVERRTTARATARDIVDQAVVNGDVTPLASGAPTNRGREPARSGDRPRYRRRSQSWRQRRAEEKQATENAIATAVPDDAEPPRAHARASLEERRARRTRRRRPRQVTHLTPDPTVEQIDDAIDELTRQILDLKSRDPERAARSAAAQKNARDIAAALRQSVEPDQSADATPAPGRKRIRRRRVRDVRAETADTAAAIAPFPETASEEATEHNQAGATPEPESKRGRRSLEDRREGRKRRRRTPRPDRDVTATKGPDEALTHAKPEQVRTTTPSSRDQSVASDPSTDTVPISSSLAEIDDTRDELNRRALDARVRARAAQGEKPSGLQDLIRALDSSLERDPEQGTAKEAGKATAPAEPEPPADQATNAALTTQAETPGAPGSADDESIASITSTVPAPVASSPAEIDASIDGLYAALPAQIAEFGAEATRPPTPEEIKRAVSAVRSEDLARKINAAVRARIEGHDDEEDPASASSQQYPAPGLAEDELARAWAQGDVTPAAARVAARDASGVADEICKHAYGERDGHPRRGPPAWRQWPGRTRTEQKIRRRRHIKKSLGQWAARAIGWITRIMVRACVAQIDAHRDAARASQAGLDSPAPRSPATPHEPSRSTPPAPAQPTMRPRKTRTTPPTAAERAAEQDGARARADDERAPSTRPTLRSQRKKPESSNRTPPRGGGIAD